MSNISEDSNPVQAWTVLPAGSHVRIVDERCDPSHVEQGREIVAFYAPHWEARGQGLVVTCRGDVLVLGNQLGDTPGIFYEIELGS